MMNRTAPVSVHCDLDNLLELAPDAIFVADLQGRYAYVNAAACQLLGWTREELLGMSITDLIRPEDRARLEQSKQSMAAGASSCSQWQLRRKDGSWADAEVTANILPNGQWQGFVRDISRRLAQQAERDAMQEQAERDRARLHAVIERLPAGVELVEPGGRITFNQKAQQLLGVALSQDGGAGQYADRIRYPDGSALPPDALPSTQALTQGKAVGPIQLLVRRDDGSEMPVLCSAAPVAGDSGGTPAALVVFQDISDTLRLQQAVRDNERLLEAVFELMPTGVRIADAQGRIVRTNRAARDLWRGRPGGPQSGEMKAWWVATGERLLYADWPARRAVRGQPTSNELVRMQCFDGSFRTVAKHAGPLRDEHGRITGAVVVDEDVTALYEAQEKVRDSERLLQTVIGLLPVGVTVADRDGEVVLSNPAGDALWQGAGPAAAGGLGGCMLSWVDSGEPVTPDAYGLARAVRCGQTTRSELIRIQYPDGSQRTVRHWAAPIRSDRGEVTGGVALNEDVTGLYRIQEQLRVAVREREHILAVVAHDLRNPLNALALRAALIEQQGRSLPGGEAVEAGAAAIREVARGMGGLVDDLLALSTARSGRSTVNVVAAPAQLLMERAAQAALPLIGQAGLHLEVSVEGEPGAVLADPDRIARVFANLLDNACKFTDKGGRVVLRAEAVPEGVAFSVANSGAPLRREEMEHLFQPFWQAGRDDRRGAGLGLSICCSIVEAHGGRVWTEAAEGMRVKFLFLLPGCSAPAGDRPPEPPDIAPAYERPRA